MALLANHASPAAAACFGRVPPPPNRLAVGDWRRRRAQKGVVAMADLLGDFGARDPFPQEVESNFGEKVLGDVDTLHRILIPTLSVLSLARVPLDPNPAPVDAADARRLLHKVVGWRLLDDADQGMSLQCVWKVRDEACGRELVTRINAAVNGAPATVLFEAPNQVRAELQTPSAGGLTVNDFIVAARIDQVKTLDLIPKKRVWA
ncbi:hypothetical protein GUJ93_ZPchr0006g42610 [Zizania palustris]|uniref:4a-hydroxytetrahydrobiopterin dehydratase n=1 Tax=Zizania palustris TaxID=103762 RepID=A0A8J5SU77_ZIZPA|nr:hypothetical protein GUJ93_ZPchr0006g42610 [Zizania palustris]